MNIKDLKVSAATCKLCDLHEGRVNPVFDKGNQNASLFICGMVPAKEENLVGIPFVGRCGKLLDVILEQTGLTLDTVYVTNLVKCFLAAGESLKEEWVDACVPYVVSQIYLLKPKIILALGKDAATALLGSKQDVTLKSIQGRLFEYAPGIHVMPTYHPSYLLRSGGEKSPTYADVLKHFQVAKELCYGV